MMQYTKKVMQHFLKPKNIGKLRSADGIGQAGNLACGDIMKIYIKVGKKKIRGKEQEFIKDIKFETLGCPAAIATSSVATELVKGKTFAQALKITHQNIIKVLGSLPPVKYHCSLLAEESLSEAIYNYLKRNKKKIPKLLKIKHKRALLNKKNFMKNLRK